MFSAPGMAMRNYAMLRWTVNNDRITCARHGLVDSTVGNNAIGSRNHITRWRLFFSVFPFLSALWKVLNGYLQTYLDSIPTPNAFIGQPLTTH